MHRRMLRKQSFDELARQFVARSATRNSGPKSAKAPGTLSDPDERTRALEPNVGTLLYLISLGVVAIATVAVFFGLGFFLLARPDDEMIAAARDRGVEVAPQRADLVSPPNTDAGPFPAQTAPAPSVPPEPSPETHEVLPPAKEAALGSAIAAGTGAANATFGASAGQGLQGDQATPPRITQSARAEISRRRHVVARKHWARISQPGVNSHPPAAASGPERAWHWIVQSATGILAALSPPPSRQVSGPKPRWRAD
jgi:hypothetical protein